MNIYIYKVEGITPTECVGVLDSYASINFTKSFKGCGTWTIKGNFTQEIERMLKVGYLIYVNPQICGICYSIEYDTDEEGTTTYTAYGNELKGILAYRIVWDTYNRKVNLRDYANDLVERNTQGNRALFSRMDKPQISTQTIDKQISYDNLLESLEDIVETATSTDGNPIGFDVYCENAERFVFTLLEGEDRTITSPEPLLFSRDLNNVSTLTYSESDKELVNVVKAGGQGEGAERVLTVVGNESLSGLARREGFADCRNLQSTYKDENGETQTISTEDYLAMLQEEAEASLTPTTLSVDAEAVVTVQQALDALGAKVTLRDRAFNVQTTDYVSEVNVIDEGDGMLVTLTIGEGLTAQRLIP